MPSTYKATVATCTYNNMTTRKFVPGDIEANNNSLGNLYCWFMVHCHKLLKPSPHYIMSESTLQFGDVGVVPGLLSLLLAVQRSCTQSRKWSRRQPGNEAIVTRAVHNFFCKGGATRKKIV